MTMRSIKRRISLFIINALFTGSDQYEIKRKLMNWAGYSIGIKTRIAGPIRLTAELVVGEDCWIGRNFTCHGNGRVVIGDRCDIAHEVVVLTGSHDIGVAKRRDGKGRIENVQIGDGCWICARATIVGNVSIAKSCIVASCACVTKSTSSNTMVGGVPAKQIKDLDV